MDGVETVTVLFTDVVGSTALRSQLGDDAADQVLRAHDDAVRRAFGSEGGRQIKHTGDGLMAAFDSAAAAVAASVRIQQTVARLARSTGMVLSVRVGVSAGDVHSEDRDLFGLPVVEAARLCGAASAGQTLVADVVRVLAGSRGGFEFRPAGLLDLKGLDGPLGAHEVVWANRGGSVPLPGWLGGVGSSGFVGREKESAALDEAWSDAGGSGRRVVLVAGEPGVGKTRLVAELARRVHSTGATVLLGRCDEVVPAPLRPVREVVAFALEHGPVEEIGALSMETHDRLRSIAGQRAGSEYGPSGDAALEAQLRHEAIDALFEVLAADSPLLVVLDDLQWADPASLLAFRHLAAERRDAPIMVVGTYRETDLDRFHPLAETLADLRRLSTPTRVRLRGLDRAGTALVVARWAGVEAPAPFVDTVLAETEGNPFFIGEVLRHLAETGAVYRDADGRWTTDRPLERLGIPDGVRETVGRRLARLPEETNHLLVVASLFGREFELDLVGAAADINDDAALDALDPALASGLVTETDTLGCFSFSHALVRATLADELTTVRRVRLHQRAGETIEALRADRLDDHVEELAHHYDEAAVAGQWDRAIRYAMRAADRISQVPEAVDRYLVRALELFDAGALHDDDLEIEILTQLAWFLGAGMDGGWTYANRAMDVAKRTGEPSRILLAIGPLANQVEVGRPDREIERLMETVLESVGIGDRPERAMALAISANQQAFTAVTSREYDVAVHRADEALAVAERLDDPEARWHALHATQNLLLGRDDPARSLAVARAILTNLPQRLHTRGSRSRIRGLLRSAAALFQLGDRPGLQEVLDEVAHRPEPQLETWIGAAILQMRAALALADGRLDESWSVAERGFLLAANSNNYSLGFYALRWALRHEGDRIDLSSLDAFASASPFPWISGLAALVRAERGDRDGAARILESFADRPDLGIPFNYGQSPVLRVLSETAAHLGDRNLAAALRPFVEPYAGQLFLAYGGVFSDGAADRAIGQLDDALGRHEAAVLRYRSALELEERFGARGHAARTRYWLARALVARGEPGDDTVARHELDASADAAEELGLAGVARLVQRVR